MWRESSFCCPWARNANCSGVAGEYLVILAAERLGLYGVVLVPIAEIPLTDFRNLRRVTIHIDKSVCVQEEPMPMAKSDLESFSETRFED